MGFRYVKANLINSTTLPDNTYVSTEDALYTVDKLYNGRPSYPFRFTAKAAQTIKVDLESDQLVTFAGVFGHNLTSAVTMTLQGAPADAGYATVVTPTWREYAFYRQFRATYRWWLLNISDAGNANMPQIGEFVLGSVGEFENARVQPGRADGPRFYRGEKQTHYGQDWSSHYSNTETFVISLTNLNDPSTVDDLHTFLRDVHEDSDGKFILIPDHDQPHCYYVRVVNYREFARREVYGTNELRVWKLELETLTRGITLL